MLNSQGFMNRLISKYIWLMPSAVVIFAAFFSYANVDTIRDVVEAKRIASGNGLVLLGPQMAFSFYIGPWWFYLQSLVAWTEYSWLFTALLTATLHSLKFYLAFKIGRLLNDHLLGVFMVLGMCLISFTFMQTITFTHTNLVETLMLLIIYLALKDGPVTQLKATLFGVLLGLAFHAHPTAMAAGYFVMIKWLQTPQKIQNAAAMVLGMFLVFAPLIIIEFNNNFMQSSGAGEYLVSKSSGFDIINYFKTLVGVIFASPYAMLSVITNHTVALIISLAQGVTFSMAFLAPFFLWKHISSVQKYLIIHTWIFAVLYTLGLVLIRSNTPWYLTYGLSLAVSLLTGMGLYLWYVQAGYKSLIKLLSSGVIIFFIVTQIGYMYRLNNGEIVVPSNILNDVKSFDFALSGQSYEILAHAAREHGQFTCGLSPVSLHGPYSQRIFSHSGIEHKSNCETALHYGPLVNGENIVGVPNQYATLIEQQPIKVIGTSSFYRPVDMSKHQAVVSETFQHDYERVYRYQEKSKAEKITTTLNKGRYLLITNVAGFRMPFKVEQVIYDGQLLTPVSSRSHSKLYHCDTCDGTDGEWTVVFIEPIENMINVVSF